MVSASLSLVVILALFCGAVSLETCSTESKCKVNGCECYNGFCINQAKAGSLIAKCFSACAKGEESEECTSCIAKEGLEVVNECSSTKLKACKKDSDCGKSSCSCITPVAQFPISLCVDKNIFNSATKNCATCRNNTECKDTCESGNGFLERSICSECLSEGETAKGVTNSLGSCSAPCVSTAWLHGQGLSHAVIRNAGASRVLCIPGLPCSTHGHLLRSSNGELVSYRKACESRTDCIESVMEVSQLRHDMDWSDYRTDDGSLMLTSLSAHPSATRLSPSRIVAAVGDSLNSMGLGKVTNMLATLSRPIDSASCFVSSLASTE